MVKKKNGILEVILTKLRRQVFRFSIIFYLFSFKLEISAILDIFEVLTENFASLEKESENLKLGSSTLLGSFELYDVLWIRRQSKAAMPQCLDVL